MSYAFFWINFWDVFSPQPNLNYQYTPSYDVYKYVIEKCEKEIISKLKIYENFKVLSFNEGDSYRFGTQEFNENLRKIFNDTEYKISLYFTEDGKICMSIRWFKPFNYYDPKMDKQLIKEKIVFESKEVKKFLDMLVNISKLL